MEIWKISTDGNQNKKMQRGGVRENQMHASKGDRQQNDTKETI